MGKIKNRKTTTDNATPFYNTIRMCTRRGGGHNVYNSSWIASRPEWEIDERKHVHFLFRRFLFEIAELHKRIRSQTLREFVLRRTTVRVRRRRRLRRAKRYFFLVWRIDNGAKKWKTATRPACARVASLRCSRIASSPECVGPVHREIGGRRWYTVALFLQSIAGKYRKTHRGKCYGNSRSLSKSVPLCTANTPTAACGSCFTRVRDDEVSVWRYDGAEKVKNPDRQR